MARRQVSVTSLSKYATGKSPNTDLFNGSKSRDFCNSFWGPGEAGVDVLLARMRGAARTMDELRNFWKERSRIEEQYAIQLADLAKTTLGKDEIGEMRNALETLQQETDNQAGFHLALAHQIRNEIQVQTAAFSTKQSLHKSTFQVPIEKRYKSKLTNEAYVNKAREKYEGDQARIGSYTAQLQTLRADSTASPRDVEKLQQRLIQTQQKAQLNEKDYAGFARVLGDILPRWEQEWKDYCDRCQDLEEERLDFMRENIWAYANAVSTLCVADDQSCEKIRLALDQFEVEKDIENFVQEYGTGSSLPDPPVQTTSATSSSSNGRPVARSAQFDRVSQRGRPYQPSEPTIPPPAAPAPAATAPPQSKYPPQQPPPQSSPPPPPIQQSPVQPAVQPPTRSPDQAVDRSGSSRRNVSHAGDVTNDGRSETQSVRSNRTQGSVRHDRERERELERERDMTGSIAGSTAVGSTRPSVDSLASSLTAVNSTGSYNYGNGVNGFINGNVNARKGDNGALSVEAPSNLAPPSEPSPRYERNPSPASENPILFYVKALYDYQATTDEEFDFQAGDVIAVTATPEDGWWIGELLDENRREPRRNVFPSNFVCLF